MNGPSESERELLAEMKRAWAEQATFFSNSGKELREQWVVREFLRALRVVVADGELCSPQQHSAVDVRFRDAQFQVKEIPDPNIRRGAEVRETYERVMAANCLADTVGPGFVYEVPEPVSGYELLRDTARALSLKYALQAGTLDLLFYVTRTRVSVVLRHEVRRSDFGGLGWRSVSCLMGGNSVVLHASDAAPSFLRQANDDS
jgi:hypothetical protein